MKLLIVLSLVLVFSSCTCFKQSPKGDAVIVSMRKSPCRGMCPVYSVQISESGLVKYEGKNNVGELGEKEKYLPKAELKSLKKAFEDADFFVLQDEYTAKVTDLSTTFITYTHKGETKQVKDYYNAPSELKALEQMVENIVVEWVK